MKPPIHTSGRTSAVSQGTMKSFESLVVTAGADPGHFFRVLRKFIKGTPDPLRAANNLHRYLSTGFSAATLNDFQQYPVLLQTILELFGQSQYLADILVRDPELFRWLTTSTVIQKTKSKEDFLGEALASVSLFNRMEKKVDALRRFHRREMLRIGAREVLGEADVMTVTGELSGLADAVVESVVQIAQQDLSVRTQAHFKSTFCVIGLGKLGGEELNFSSDIDLMFVYEADGEFEVPQERIHSFRDYYNRLAEFVVRKLTEYSGEGRLYRVDMRLRPEGSAGALALSRRAYSHYYETRGEMWERQMLVKARPIAGNVRIGEEWLSDIRPFVYPKTFMTSPLDEIFRMKEKIEESKDVSSNIKLGRGGIRDVEFVVQALQLMNGGKEEQLRETNTLKALRLLAGTGKMRKPDGAALKQAYEFLRRVEHRLQLLHGSQTHSLPEMEAEAELLARRLGFRSTRSFNTAVNAHRKRTRRIFDALFGKKGGRGGIHGSLTVRMHIPRLSQHGFVDLDGARTCLEHVLRDVPSIHHVEMRGLLRLLKKHGAPDWALRNLAMILASSPIRRAFLQAFQKADLLDLLVLVCARSKKMAERLSMEPLLFETLVGQPEDLFVEHWGWGFLETHDPNRFQSYNEFKILLPFFLGDTSLQSMTQRLSDLAETIILRQFNSVPDSSKTCLVALGKFGGREITVGSDLDLLLLYDQDELQAAAAETVAQQLADLFMQNRTYVLDFRLRPEGKNAPLATEMSYFAKYLKERASLWERQSFLRSRVLSGNKRLKKQFEDTVHEYVYGMPLSPGWIDQIAAMREKMEHERSRQGVDLKLGRGGLVDLEFTIQILQLMNGKVNKEIRTTNMFSAAHTIGRQAMVRKDDAARIEINLAVMRKLETYIRLNVDHTDILLPTDEVQQQALNAALGGQTRSSLVKQVERLQKQNRAMLERTYKECR